MTIANYESPARTRAGAGRDTSAWTGSKDKAVGLHMSNRGKP